MKFALLCLVLAAYIYASDGNTALKAVIKNADMPEYMQQDAIECATQAMEKFNIEKEKFNIEKEKFNIAAYIKKEFDKKYNPTWYCIVGRNFDSYVTHKPKPFIYFYMGQVPILLFRNRFRSNDVPSTGEKRDMPVSYRSRSYDVPSTRISRRNRAQSALLESQGPVQTKITNYFKPQSSRRRPAIGTTTSMDADMFKTRLASQVETLKEEYDGMLRDYTELGLKLKIAQAEDSLEELEEQQVGIDDEQDEVCEDADICTVYYGERYKKNREKICNYYHAKLSCPTMCEVCKTGCEESFCNNFYAKGQKEKRERFCNTSYGKKRCSKMCEICKPGSVQ